MVRRRLVTAALAPVLALAVLTAAAPSAQALLPEEITVKDGGSSEPMVNITKVGASASWYWDSEQYVYVKVPAGFRTGHRLSVWFDIDSDGEPDGHYELRLGEVKNKNKKYLVREQQFRLGGGWTHGGAKVRCGGSDGYAPPASSDVRRGQRTITLALDLWSCLKTPNPGELESGAWRIAVAVARNGEVDMAPNHRKWSPFVAGWGPCDPSGGDCS